MSFQKLLTFLFMALLGVALTSFLGGCHPAEDDDDATGDDDDNTGDDDDDDSGDDDDDDSGDDDDDDAQPEPFWFGYSFMITLEGGAGTVDMSVTSYEGDESGLGDEICAQQVQFAATSVETPAQGADFWQFIDETVTFTGPGTTVDNGCWWEPVDMWGEEWDIAVAWMFNPLAFVSCDAAASNPNLGDQMIGPDPFDLVTGDLTLSDMCTEVGPALAGQVGTGDMEGIWLIPMPADWLSSFGNYEYFVPDDNTNVETWGFFGYLMNDAANTVGEGMDGTFHTISFLVLG